MMKIESITFPAGLYGQKLRYLHHGFELLGIKTILAPYVKKQIAVPIEVKTIGGAMIHAYLDVAVETAEVVEKLVDGKNFYFKTHLDTRLRENHRRLYPMPQALGHNEYLEMIEPLRKKRRERKAFDCQIFGTFAYSEQRALACKIVSESWFTKRYIGINKDRHPEARTPAPLICERLPFEKYFEEMSVTAMALAFPSHKGFEGNGPWCSFRHVEAWALGVPIVTVEPGRYGRVGTYGRFWFETESSLVDLIGVMTMALAWEDKRKEFSERSIEYFETYLRPERHALYFLGIIEDELKGN